MTRAALAILASISALPVAAAEPEACHTIALHPVVVNGADPVADREMIAELQTIAVSELLKRQRTLQDSAIVAEALSKLPNHECVDNDCLAKLAHDTKSDCTAYFAVTPSAGRNLFLSARLIPSSGPDRPIFSRGEHYDRVGKTPRDWSVSALQRFIRAVPLPDPAAVEPFPLLPPSPGNGPPLAPVPPPPSVAIPAPSTAAPAGGLDWRTPVGIGTAAAGVGAAIAGTLIYTRADADWRALLDSAGGVPFPASRADEILAAYRSTRGNMQLGSAGIIGGVALTAAGAGLVLWQLLGKPVEKKPEAKLACGFTIGTVQCSLALP